MTPEPVGTPGSSWQRWVRGARNEDQGVEGDQAVPAARATPDLAPEPDLFLEWSSSTSARPSSAGGAAGDLDEPALTVPPLFDKSPTGDPVTAQGPSLPPPPPPLLPALSAQMVAIDGSMAALNAKVEELLAGGSAASDLAGRLEALEAVVRDRFGALLEAGSASDDRGRHTEAQLRALSSVVDEVSGSVVAANRQMARVAEEQAALRHWLDADQLAPVRATLDALRSAVAAVGQAVAAGHPAEPAAPDRVVELERRLLIEFDELRSAVAAVGDVVVAGHPVEPAPPGRAVELESRLLAELDELRAEVVALRRRIPVRAKPSDVLGDDVLARLADEIVARLKRDFEVVDDRPTERPPRPARPRRGEG